MLSGTPASLLGLTVRSDEPPAEAREIVATRGESANFFRVTEILATAAQGAHRPRLSLRILL
eukprot:6847594-Pyramimonas_sp.AAC.1